MFSYFRKPKPKPEPTPDYRIEVNGLGQYFIYYQSTVYPGNYSLFGDRLIFDSREDAEKYLFEYLDRKEKLGRRVVSEIFLEKEEL